MVVVENRAEPRNFEDVVSGDLPLLFLEGVRRAFSDGVYYFGHCLRNSCSLSYAFLKGGFGVCDLMDNRGFRRIEVEDDRDVYSSRAEFFYPPVRALNGRVVRKRRLLRDVLFDKIAPESHMMAVVVDGFLNYVLPVKYGKCHV